MQSRYINFGDPAVADGINAITNTLASTGVFEGGDFFVINATTMSIAPFKVIQPSGIVITEGDDQSLNIDNTSVAANYTIVYRHQQEQIIGGSPALLEKLNGLQSIASVTDGVVLGWVLYPGGTIPINTNMFITVKKSKLTNNLTRFDQPPILPPIDQKTLPVSASGAVLDVTTTFDGMQSCTSWKNNGGTLGSVTFVIPYRVGQIQITKIISTARVDTDATLTFDIIDVDGSVITPTNNVYTNDSDFVLREATLPQVNNQQNSATIPHLRVVMNILPTREVCIAGLWLSEYNLPID